MPQVTFTMTADESRAVQGFLKVAEAQKQAEEGARKLNLVTKETTQELANMYSGAKTAGEVGAQAMASLKSAVEGVTAAVGALGAVGMAELARMEEKTKSLRGEMETLQQALGAAGQTSLLPEIQAALGGIGSQQYTTGDLSKMFKEAQLLSKGKVGNDVLLGAVGETALAGEAGKDTGAFMGTYMRLATGTLQGADKGEISDATTELMRALPGGLDDSWDKALGRMTAMGVDGYDAMRWVTAAARSDEGAKSLNTLLEQAGKEVQDPRAKAKAQELEQQLRDIEDRRTAIEADDLSTLPKSKRQAAERDRRAELKELSNQATSVRREIQDLREAKVKLPSFSELGRNPELLDEMGKAAFANLAGELNAGEFTTESAGMFGRDLAEARGARNRDPRARGLARLRALEVAQANRMARASVRDVAASVEAAELDNAVEARGGLTRMIYNANIPGVGGMKDLSRGMWSGGGMTRGDSAELLRVQIVGDSTKRPSIARNGSNEPAARRQR